jgi:glycosyltransferase involved in cell wall biosynthesis
MRIVHIIAYFTPQWKYQENYLATEQVKAGHEVHIVTSNLNFPPDFKATSAEAMGPQTRQIQTEFVDGYAVHSMGVFFEFSGRVLLKGALKKIKEIGPDLIICHGITQPFTLQLLFGKHIECRIIADEHVLLTDLDNSTGKRIFFRLYGHLIRKKLLERFSKIVAISDGVRLLFTSLMGFPDESISIIPLGTDVDSFRPDIQLGRTFRQNHGINENAMVIGYTGKMGDHKKVHYLVDAANESGIKDLHLLFVGDIVNDYATFLHEKLQQSKVPVTLLPSLPNAELPAVYNACDILAWPAHQTISTVNASACGKPIICSGFLKERYGAGQGIGIESGDYDAFKNALNRLISDEDLRKEMGARGREWAVNEVSWSIINKRFIA